MRYVLLVALLAGLAGVPLFAQATEADGKQPEKKEAAGLNVYEATFSGMT